MAGTQDESYLDVARGMAISLVVLGHAVLWLVVGTAQPWYGFLYGVGFTGIPAFAAVAGVLDASQTGRPMRGFAAKKARRLLLPLAVVLPLFVAVPYVVPGIAATYGIRPTLAESAVVVLGGSELWFLPLLFAATVLGQAWLSSRRPATWWALATVAALYAGVGLFARATPTSVAFGTYWPLLPVILVAYAAGRMLPGLEASPLRAAAALVPLSLTSGALWALCGTPGPAVRPGLSWPAYALSSVAGPAFVLMLRGLRRVPAAPIWARLGRRSLGIYIVHPALLGLVLMVPDMRTPTGILPAGVLVLTASAFASPWLMKGFALIDGLVTRRHRRSADSTQRLSRPPR